MAKVIAVIPTYNSAELVIQRIEELAPSSFEEILVCDDKSTDNTIALLNQKYGTDVKVISGDTNLGPGGNRNRILSNPALENSDYLFFIDADCKVIYEGDLATLVKDSFINDSYGAVGYSITNNDNEPMKWNYGDLMHPVHEASDQKLEDMLKGGLINEEQFMTGAPARAATFRLLPEPAPKPVGWVAEGCFAIRTELYEKLGGFAAQMRYHETHDFNARVQENGYLTIFNPINVAQHLAYDSRMHRREEDIRTSRLYYYQQHWGMSEEVFVHLFDEA